jgi:hypothetical protein
LYNAVLSGGSKRADVARMGRRDIFEKSGVKKGLAGGLFI